MRMLEPLRVPAFRRLAATYGLNELGWGLVTLALAVLVYERTGSPLAPTALFLASTFVPALLSPALVARVDQLPVRQALGGLYVAEAALFGCLAAFVDVLPVGVVIALALVDGALALSGRAITRASVAATLECSGQLRAGNALLNIVFAVALMAGPALGGAVVAGAGVSVSLIAGAALFLAMAVIARTGRTLPAGAHDETSGKGWIARAREGLAYARSAPVTRRLLLTQAAVLVFCTLATPIEIVYAHESLGGTTATYGLLLAAWGAGTIIGSVVFARCAQLSVPALIVAALAVTAAGFATMAVAPSVAVAMAGCVLGGLGNGIQVVAVMQALQERVATEFQARVMSLSESLNASAMGAGFLLGGAIATVGSPRTVFAVAAVGVLLAAPLFVAALRPRRERGDGRTRPVRRPEPVAGSVVQQVA